MKFRKIAVVAFAIYTVLLIGWMGLLWISLNLLSFPCEEAHPGYSCAESIRIEFIQQTGLPVLLWLAAGLLLALTRKRTDRPGKEGEATHQGGAIND